MSENMKNAPSIPESREGMEYLVNLGRERADVRVVEINGEYYTPDTLRRIEKPLPKRCETFRAATLTGLVDYLLSGIDEFIGEYKRVLVNVETPTYVEVLSPIHGSDARRDCIAVCQIDQPSLHRDFYMDPEDFNIMLQTRVLQSPNRDLVLKFVGSLKDEQSNQTADDGFSQRVTVKTGVATVGDVTVVNPVYLAPRRTFPEVAQPESPYVLRFREGPKCALFDTDNLTWRNEAIENIGQWLREKLDGHPEFVVIA